MQEMMQFASNNLILSIAWVVLLILVVVTTFSSLFSKVKTISRVVATRMINKDDAIVVDIRSRDDYRKGHITGAINVTATDIKNDNFGELSKHKDKPIIVVCASGHSATDSASRLIAAGYANVSILKEGIAGWSGENLPLVRNK